jgi:hypothetical protein
MSFLHRGKVKEVEKRFGKSFEQLLPEVLNLYKTEMAAAVSLQVYPGTVRYWRMKLGIEKNADGVWVKAGGEPDASN